MIAGLQMRVGGLAPGALATLVQPARGMALSPWLMIGFVHTTIVPGLAAAPTRFALVRRIGATRAAGFHFLNPSLGVATAALMPGEGPGPADIAAVAVVIAVILAVQRGRIRKAAAS